MQRLFLVPLLSLVLLCAGCHEKTPKVSSRRLADESAGQAALARARQQLATQHYDSARATIRTMRRAHPHALTAREDGILLMDSIDLARHSHRHRPNSRSAPLSRPPGRTFPPTGKHRSTRNSYRPLAVLRNANSNTIIGNANLMIETSAPTPEPR